MGDFFVENGVDGPGLLDLTTAKPRDVLVCSVWGGAIVCFAELQRLQKALKESNKKLKFDPSSSLNTSNSFVEATIFNASAKSPMANCSEESGRNVSTK